MTTARNEAIKLRAAFYNNLAVGAVLAGVVLPVVTFYETHSSLVEFFADHSLIDLYGFVLPPVLGVTVAVLARVRVEVTLEKLTD